MSDKAKVTAAIDNLTSIIQLGTEAQQKAYLEYKQNASLAKKQSRECVLKFQKQMRSAKSGVRNIIKLYKRKGITQVIRLRKKSGLPNFELYHIDKQLDTAHWTTASLSFQVDEIALEVEHFSKRGEGGGTDLIYWILGLLYIAHTLLSHKTDTMTRMKNYFR